MTKPTQKVLCIQLKGSQRFLRLLGDSSKIKGLRSGLVTLKPQELIGEHKTENKEEVIIVLRGSATIYFGRNKKLKAAQNTFVFIPPETLHNVKNSGNKNLQYVYVTTQVV
jgi:mannose-6-phosphate isomerase-like protein (cupin superfamily)